MTKFSIFSMQSIKITFFMISRMFRRGRWAVVVV